MKVFETSHVREIDKYTIENEPVSSIDLMERASLVFASRFKDYFSRSIPVSIFAGAGNNGGDALAVARMLLEEGYKVNAYLVNISGKLSSDCEINYNRMAEKFPQCLHKIFTAKDFPAFKADEVVIDGIFGSGLSRPVEGIASDVIKYINQSGRYVVAIDIPSGLMGEDNRDNINEHIIRADRCFTFQFPFLSFFFAENHIYTGDFEVLDIGLHPEAISTFPASIYAIDNEEIKRIIKPRSKFSHKGNFGHALIVAGSYGMMGAAVLSARACLRGGAGLVTVHVPECGIEILQGAVPEALCSVDNSDKTFTSFPLPLKYMAIGIGPGLGNGPEQAAGLFKLIRETSTPIVIDADALNILGENPEWLDKLPEGSILTPHPGEFDRLAGKSESMYERYLKQIELAARYRVNIILKGAYSILVTPDGETWFNTTGNPGMATGGSGDVLTGLLVSLLAQGYKPVEASKSGMFIHGLAGDLASSEFGEQALIATDIVCYLGKAFLKLRNDL